MSVRSYPELPGYKILKPLGTGAHATICLAVEPKAGEKVAVKRIVRRNADDDRFLTQAESEFDIARRFEHPILRRCREMIRVRKWLQTRVLFLIMDYAEGDTLEHHPPTRLVRTLGIFSRVAEGLHALHKLGFVHADIKPNNIILGKGGEVRIIDFGQSCPLGHRKERVQGTPDYIAPEQVLRHPLDQRTDVFNLGATLYWTLTRRPLVTLMPSQKDQQKLVDLKTSRENLPPHEINPKIPVAVSRIVMRCCESEPAARPRDMREVMTSLDVLTHVLEKRAAEGGGEDRATHREGRTRRAEG